MAAFPLFVLASVTWAGSMTVNKSGSMLHWTDAYVPFMVNTNGKHGLAPDEVEATLRKAADQWDQIEGSWLELAYEGDTDRSAPDNSDGVNAVFFEEDWGDGRDPNLLALTYVWSLEDGQITHFDIAINTDDHAWSIDGNPDRNDLWNALVHEFGHALGLDHSEDADATMYFQTSVGETSKRDLSADDVETFASVYGGEYPYEAFMPVGCASAAGSTPGAWWLLGGLALLLRRRDQQGAK